MPRQARLDAPGVLHHVMVRGLERRAIFRDDTDRADFVRRVARLAEAQAWTVYAWALLPNHAHLLVRTGGRALARSMRSLLALRSGAPSTAGTSGWATFGQRRSSRKMAARYRLSGWRRLANWLVRGLLAVGLGPPRTYLLTVRGRRTGRPYSTPVTLVIEGDQRWLVAPYGEVGWVKNARATGRVTLSRGRQAETVRIAEVGPEEAAPILRQYVRQVPITRPFFDVTPDSLLEAFRAEAPRHPVFRILGPPRE